MWKRYSIFVFVVLFFLISGCSTGPEILPQEKVLYDMAVESIKKASKEIKIATDVDADESMPKEYNRARGYLATAESKLNEKKFTEARELAEKAGNEAKLARELPRDSRSSVSNAMLIVSSVNDSELSKLFPDLITQAEKDLQDAKRYLDRKEFAMAKNYADKVINELGAKKDKFNNAIKAIKNAESEISAAKLVEADKFVSDEFDSAETLLKNAIASLKDKDFDRAKNNAESASLQAKNVKVKLPDVKRNLETTTKNEIDEAKNTLDKAKQSGAEQYALELLKIAEVSISNADLLLNQNRLLEARESSKKAKLDAESVLSKTNEEIARIKASEEDEARKKAEEEARLKAEEDAKKKAEDEEKRKEKKPEKKVKKKIIKKK